MLLVVDLSGIKAIDMLTLPLVSFCVPVFGTQKYLAACLESIKAEITAFRSSLFSFVRERNEGASSNTRGRDVGEASGNALCDARDKDDLSSCNIQEFLTLLDTALQDSASPLFEIIIVDDGTPNKADKKLFPQIIKQYKADLLSHYQTMLKVVEHSKNLGLVEARRSAVTLAKGMWILFVDSDDEMTGASLLHLILSAICFDADIVQGRFEMVLDFETSAESEKRGYTQAKLNLMEEKCKRVHKGILEGGDILRNFVLDSGHSSFLPGKLFATDLVQKAFGEIPHCYCVMSEDLLIYFFILMHARRYCGIESIVYKYFIGRGVSSNKEIASMESWNASCTAGSVFAIIFDYIDEVAPQRLSSQVRAGLEAIASSLAISNVKQFFRVVPSLQEEAYDLLISYWGEEIVTQAQAWIEENKR